MSFFDIFKKTTKKNTIMEETTTTEKVTEQEKTTPTDPQSEQPQPKDDGKAHIYNLIIVDESGSMGGLERATLSGVNETLGTIRQAQKEFGEKQQHYVTLVTFDSPGAKGVPVRTLIDMQPIEVVKDFADYDPHGCTPLYDAMGQSITRLHNIIKDDANATAVVTVLTDGLENASREFSGRQLKQLIEQLKEQGWTFSYMGSAHDVKSVTDLLSIDNVMEFSHDARSTSHSWSRESSAKMRHYRKMSLDWENLSCMDASSRHSAMKSMSEDYYGGRVTPTRFDSLEPDQVLVFGSDPEGHHSGGLARLAVERFGAIVGQGVGMQGQCYAIPTTEGLAQMQVYVRELLALARRHPSTQFLVSPLGCGHAGLTPQQVAPLFADAVNMENVALPQEFWAALGIKNYNM